MTDDYLGFGDPVERQIARGPAFIVGPRVGPREVEVLEQLHRLGSKDFPAASETLFTMETDDGLEIWDPPTAPNWIDQGVRWQRIMQWPSVPTVADAEAYQANARRALVASWWDRLAAARADDEAGRPARGSRAVKPEG